VSGTKIADIILVGNLLQDLQGEARQENPFYFLKLLIFPYSLPLFISLEDTVLFYY
jgi:hypothetical protein